MCSTECDVAHEGGTFVLYGSLGVGRNLEGLLIACEGAVTTAPALPSRWEVAVVAVSGDELLLDRQTVASDPRRAHRCKEACRVSHHLQTHRSLGSTLGRGCACRCLRWLHGSVDVGRRIVDHTFLFVVDCYPFTDGDHARQCAHDCGGTRLACRDHQVPSQHG